MEPTEVDQIAQGIVEKMREASIGSLEADFSKASKTDFEKVAAASPDVAGLALATVSASIASLALGDTKNELGDLTKVPKADFEKIAGASPAIAGLALAMASPPVARLALGKSAGGS